MMKSPLPILLLAAPLFLASPLRAQTLPAASAISIPAGTDPKNAIAIIDKIPTEQAAAFIAAFDPTVIPAESRDDVLTHAFALSRRAHAAQLAEDQKIEEDWQRRTGLEAYKSFGNHSPAWDELAITALANNVPSAVQQSTRQFKAAVDAGCTDPLVRYYYVRRALMANTMKPAAALAQYLDILPDLTNSQYSPLRKFHLRILIIRLCLDAAITSDQNRDIASDNFDAAIQLLPSLAAEHGSPIILREDITLLNWAAPRLNRVLKTTFDQINPQLATLFPNDPFPFSYAADFYTNWAWEARGGGFASSVTDAGWKLFGERLALAETAATDGIARFPLDGKCPAQMITICMGRSYDRPTMENWFTRAILADPDNLAACQAKYYYLLPKWFGSREEVLAFGRQCVAAGNAQNRIPTVLLDAHYTLANDSGDTQTYYSQADVWLDIDAAYKKLLADTATERQRNLLLFDRAKYIHYALDCRQWQAALDLMNQFNDEVDLPVFGGKAAYHFLKKKAAQQAAALTQPAP